MRFRIHKLKPAAREVFRWSAHTGGQAAVKEKDYEAAGEIEAASEYAAWKLLNERGEPLYPGDLLECIPANGDSGPLKIAKYIGFEPAVWWIPVPKAHTSDEILADSAPQGPEIVRSV
jgi:hypothetical protein